MLALSKLALIFVAAMNLAHLRAVDGRVAVVAASMLVALGLARRFGPAPLSVHRQAWMALINDHRATLAKRFRQLVRINAYGFEEKGKWQAELARFRVSVGLDLDARHAAAFDRLATRRIRRLAEGAADHALAETEDAMTPEDYEHHCAELLRRNGWSAEVTGMSGDQGVDVVAERDGVSIALQCKLHFSRPVGNKAVQEAHAAADFAETSHAAVVTNAAFTRSAEALATKLGVLLLHHSDLPRLDRLLTTDRVAI